MELKMIAVVIKQRPALSTSQDAAQTPVTLAVKEEPMPVKKESQTPEPALVNQEPSTPQATRATSTPEPQSLKVQALPIREGSTPRPEPAEELAIQERQETRTAYFLPAPVAPMIRTAESVPEDTGLPSPVSDADVPQWATAQEFGVESQATITDVRLMNNYPWLPSVPSRPLPRVVGHCTLELAKKRSLHQEEKQALYNILNSFKSIPVFSNTIVSSLRIKDLLTNILGENPLAKTYEYPEPLQRNASILLDRLDVELEAEQQLEEQNNASFPDASSDSDGDRSRKRKRAPAASASRQPRTPLAAINDATYRNIMRGILKSAQSYRLDPSREHYRSSHVFGHNGLQVGQWWPLRICALRDGAHGSSQGGIAWTSNQGATSIVVSGQYADLDLDRGETLYYSGSNSHTNTEPDNPQLSAATRSLRVSAGTRRPVRVIRSAQGNNRFSPSHGLRYDGLYAIVGEEVRHNGKGGAYLRFKLVRRGAQEAIQASRPSAKEREIYGWIKEGYAW